VRGLREDTRAVVEPRVPTTVERAVVINPAKSGGKEQA